MKKEKAKLLSCLLNFPQLATNIDLPKKTCYVCVNKSTCGSCVIIGNLFEILYIQKCFH